MDQRVHSETITDDNIDSDSYMIAKNPMDWFFGCLFIKPMETSESIVDHLFTLQSGLASHEAGLSELWLEWWKQSESISRSWSESVFVSWSDAQRQLADSWLQSVSEHLLSELKPVPDTATSVLELWQESASHVLDLQTEWLQLYAPTVSGTAQSEVSPAPGAQSTRLVTKTATRKTSSSLAQAA